MFDLPYRFRVVEFVRDAPGMSALFPRRVHLELGENEVNLSVLSRELVHEFVVNDNTKICGVSNMKKGALFQKKGG